MNQLTSVQHGLRSGVVGWFLRVASMTFALLCVAGCSGDSTNATASATPAVATVVVAAPAVVPGANLAPRTKATGCVSRGGLPDPDCTPGATDPRVTQATLEATICRSGYTATVRPSSSVTDKIKREQMAAYGVQHQPLADFELDHLVGLEVGGAPADIANLWPEPRTGDANAKMKDAVENFLNREVCRGAMPLAEAQHQMATDWLAVYNNRHLSPAR